MKNKCKSIKKIICSTVFLITVLFLLSFCLSQAGNTGKLKEQEQKGIFGTWIYHLDFQLLGGRMQQVCSMTINPKKIREKNFQKSNIGKGGEHTKSGSYKIETIILDNSKKSGRLILKSKDGYQIYFFSELSKNSVRILIENKTYKSVDRAKSAKADLLTENSWLFRKKANYDKLNELPELKRINKTELVNWFRVYNTMMNEKGNQLKALKAIGSGMGLLSGIYLKNEVRQKAFIKTGYNPFKSFDALVQSILKYRNEVDFRKIK